jgi:hypothetical protein
MWRALRVVGIVVLTFAMLNATAGVCLCRDKGPDSLADRAGSRSCCHRTGLMIGGTGTSCCQIENVPHSATSPEVVVIAQPLLTSMPAFAPDVRVDAPPVVMPACRLSPPGRVLRV